MNTPKKIELIARALIVRDGTVLLCRNLDGGHCYLPGGHIEPGESARGALVREMDEEAGVFVQVDDLVAVQEHRFEQGGRARHEINLVFHVELSEEQGVIKSREADITFEWASPNTLAGTRFVPTGLIGLVQGLVAKAAPQSVGGGPVCPTATFLEG